MSPTFIIIFPSKGERVLPAGMLTSLIKCAVVFCVCDVCVVVLTRVTLAVTCAVCTLDSVTPSRTTVLPVCTVYIVSGVPAVAGATSLVIILKVFAILFSYPPRAIARAVASSSVAFVDIVERLFTTVLILLIVVESATVAMSLV